jgi:hypothetical protein
MIDETGERLARVWIGTGDLREIILGAQDNLINVLATVLGVAIGSGSRQIVAGDGATEMPIRKGSAVVGYAAGTNRSESTIWASSSRCACVVSGE